MLAAIPKPVSKATYEYSESNRKRNEIRADIKKIETVLLSDDEAQLKETHMYIDCKYSAYVPDWDKSVYGYFAGHGFNYELLDKDSIIHNLKAMKAKLDGYSVGLEKPSSKSYSSSNNLNISLNNNNDINNTNEIHIDISIAFEQARQQVENMTSLTNEQTKEILEKIALIEESINGEGTKKSKWEKLKPILGWLADKSFDVGMTLLPLILKIQ